MDPKFLRNQRFAKKVTLKLQEAWMAYVDEQKATPAFAKWQKELKPAPGKKLPRHPTLVFATEQRTKNAEAYKAWEKKWLAEHSA